MKSLFARTWFGPTIIALAAWLAIAATIDPAGSYPSLPEGPGLTVDELFNVEQGVYLVEAIRIYGLGLLDPGSIRDVFGPNSVYLPDHPPLGRLWLGLHHQLTRMLVPPFDPEGAVTACARTGSATAFALTVLLVGWYVGTQFGRIAGNFSALFLVLMPRVWGHAHLASLETITNLTCTSAVIAALFAWNRSAPPTFRGSLFAGIILGLALLTKIQAVLLPIPLAAWCLWKWRSQALKPLLFWGVAATVVFFVGWPWLWLDPIGHAKDYFARTTARASLSVWYFGTHYADKGVPWHYPWVMFLTTTPLTTLLLGGYGLWTKSQVQKSSVGVRRYGGAGVECHTLPPPHSPTSAPPHLFLLAANVIFPLLVFSLPGVAVYDGERLFLTVFPFWAMLAGIGTAKLWDHAARRDLGRLFVAACLIAQTGSLIWIHPCYLSSYNALVNGTKGAERLGLETTYWGDSITRTLLEDIEVLVPRSSTIHLSPVLHQFQVDGPRHRADLIQQSPILRRHDIRLVPFNEETWEVNYLLVYRRRADLPAELRSRPPGAKLLTEIRRGNCQLAALYDITAKNDED